MDRATLPHAKLTISRCTRTTLAKNYNQCGFVFIIILHLSFSSNTINKFVVLFWYVSLSRETSLSCVCLVLYAPKLVPFHCWLSFHDNGGLVLC